MNELGVVSSEEMTNYFQIMKKDCHKALNLAEKARKKGYDPEDQVGVTLARTLAERVIGLISVAAPQVKKAGIEKRIEELEAKYGILDWRVCFTIALEVAQQKYCKFETDLEAIEVGVRVGFAYLTLGVVSAPLEGLTTIELKDRLDGKGKYFCLNFSGPIRNAGGTAAAVCVLIADYVRNKMGYATYDPTEKEIHRCAAELSDYHTYVTNLQYHPSEKESEFLMKNLPVEISGDPSEKFEVSNAGLKDLPRVNTNQIRSGYCLIHSSCIPLKGPKIWKQLSKWGEEFDMGHWKFMGDFVKLQKKVKSAGQKAESSDVKITPDYTYIKDLVAGRPVLAYPLKPGGFRLRYGRSRASGYSGQAIHPSTMHVLGDYIASATQLKVERPGKAAAFMPCDTIDGPIVRLTDGTVLQLNREEDAIKYKNQIKKIIYLGDVLINYGDFYDRNHNLVPAGYCQEWWVQEVVLSGKNTGLSEERWKEVTVDPLRTGLSYEEAKKVAITTDTPLHPGWTYFWNVIHPDQLKILLESIDLQNKTVRIENREKKETLEILGVPHKVIHSPTGKTAGIQQDVWQCVVDTLGLSSEDKLADAITKLDRFMEDHDAFHTLEFVQGQAPFKLRDKGGTFIGARMGRPEKAKMRKLTGSPHTLFPIGEEGGRLRSFQEAIQKGKVTADFPLRHCKECDKASVMKKCFYCDSETEQKTRTIERYDGTKIEVLCARQSIQIRDIFQASLDKLKFKIYPDLIKGVRGTANRSHIPEHPAKGILRAKYEITVNKDGTTRYDCSEVTLTHFKPAEVSVPIEKLIELGYTHDVHNKPLTDPEQILELKPQDVVIPCCDAPGYPDEPCDEVLFRTTKFIDESLKKLYGQKSYYNLKSKEELVGHYIVGLAPHTSAGIVGRIIGFSKTQGFLAHPLYHAAMRRDCDGDESCIILLMDVFLNFSPKFLPETRGSTMDAPLVVTYILDPAAVDDMAFNVDRVWNYPLEMYNLALEYKKPYDIEIDLIGAHLGKPEQFEGMGFTHDTTSLNAGVLCSAYKILPSMQEKLEGQMVLAEKIQACDEAGVATLVIEKHFIRDIKGNLRKYTQQEWRCVTCNEKFRRPPLIGRCTVCNGKIVFTISEGSIVKYLEPSLSLANAYNVPFYVKQDLQLLKRKVEDLFGKDKEVQEGLGKWFG